MLFICYPKCTTCQKAKKYLDDNKIEYELRDIKEDRPKRKELEKWYKASGLPLKKFFNTSGLQYKALNLKEKLPEMSEKEQLDLLATDGMLVKRPILVTDGKILVGDAVGVALVFIACAAFAAAFGGASPVSFFKELVGFAPVPFAINSSNACLPQTIDFCEGKFGVNRKLAMFTLPVGIQFNMNSTGFYIAIVTVLMARTCGIALDAETLLSLFISLFIVSFTLPGCPGSALIGLSSVFAAVGVPMGAVTVFLCIDPIASMINTVGNVASNIASTLIAGKPQGESRS